MAVRKLQEMGENLQTIVKRLTANQNLLKLLYYTDKDPFNNQDLDEETIKTKVFNKLIKIVPKLDPKETATSIISFRVVRGRKTSANGEFNNITINFAFHHSKFIIRIVFEFSSILLPSLKKHTKAIITNKLNISFVFFSSTTYFLRITPISREILRTTSVIVIFAKNVHLLGKYV